MLEIRNLHAEVDGKAILNGINLTVNEGEVHAVMGPNGSGKSTLSYLLAGRPGYDITQGDVIYRGQDINELEPHERVNAGIFLAYQYPVEIPGVATMTFLKTALEAKAKADGEEVPSTANFIKNVRAEAGKLGISMDMLKRPLNAGFSGGEKKRLEILQMALLQPKLMVLDETDSGLDIDALKIVSEGVNALRTPERSMIVITHYQRLLNHIVPDHVHVLSNGKIIKSGGRELALELEAKGYGDIVDAA